MNDVFDGALATLPDANDLVGDLERKNVIAQYHDLSSRVLFDSGPKV